MRLSSKIVFFCFFFCLVCSHNFADDPIISISQEDLNHHTFLVSYGGSGNTWLRYCLEYLTKRPTLKFRSTYKTLDKIRLDTTTKHMKLPINNAIPLGVDYSNPPIFKVHLFKKETPLKKFSKLTKAVYIMLVRNPKECVLRNSGSSFETAYNRLSQVNFSYYVNLKIFDAWNPKSKKIVYYEDLIEQPEKTLKELLDYLGEDDQYLSSFMQDYEFHKQRSLEFYKFTMHSSKSKGQSAIFHSNKLTDQQKQALDEIVKTTYPLLWKKYLKRYAEP